MPNSSTTLGEAGMQPGQGSKASLPRKRGRPSKKDILQKEMQERQARLQKRVKFDEGREGTIYQSEEDSDEGRAGEDEEGAGQGTSQGGAGDFGSGSRRRPGSFEEYIKVSNCVFCMTFSYGLQ